MAPHQLLLALGARLLLVMIGVPALLQARMEVAGPLWSMEAIQEAAAQLRLASGEGQGTAGAANPLLALLAGAAAGRPCLWAAGLAADAASAWLLSRLAGDGAGRAFLWSPFAALVWLAGSAAPLHNLLVIAAARAAAARRPALAGAALAGAIQLSPHSALFGVPLLLLLWSGPEPGAGGTANKRSSSSSRTPPLFRCIVFLGSLAAALLLLLAAEGAAAAHLAAAGAAARPAAAASRQGSVVAEPLHWVRRGAKPVSAVPGMTARWFVRRLHFVSQVEDLIPNLGLAWYFFAEVFPKFRSYFCYCFNVLPAAMAVPLALRFPRRPLLCLLCQALAACLLGPYPSYSDVALWLGLLPVAAPQLALLRGRGWWALAFLAVLVLNSAAYQLWWVRGIANANFLYGMNLAWAAWQVLFIVQLLKATARLELQEASLKAGGPATAAAGTEAAAGGGSERQQQSTAAAAGEGGAATCSGAAPAGHSTAAQRRPGRGLAGSS